MNADTVISIGQNALYVTMLLIFVLLIPSLIVGIVISMIQAATQINEMTLSFIPKLLTTFAVLSFGGSWIIQILLDFMTRTIESIPQVIG